MQRDHVISKLREHELELRAAGIKSLSLFGSLARGDSDDESDVDLMADFDRAKRLSLLGAIGIENKITDILGVKADLLQREMLKPDVLQRATREAVLVF